MELILAEQLLLLFLDDEKGSHNATWGGDPGLAGAILLDLTARRALTEQDGDLLAVPGAAPEHQLLADAHAAIAASEKRRDARGWVGRLPKELKPLRERTAERLVHDDTIRGIQAAVIASTTAAVAATAATSGS
jgi:Golgi phosphoprotein 3 (GPP34)